MHILFMGRVYYILYFYPHWVCLNKLYHLHCTDIVVSWVQKDRTEIYFSQWIYHPVSVKGIPIWTYGRHNRRRSEFNLLDIHSWFYRWQFCKYQIRTGLRTHLLQHHWFHLSYILVEIDGMFMRTLHFDCKLNRFRLVLWREELYKKKNVAHMEWDRCFQQRCENRDVQRP
jgi:hypothetical protein